MRILAITSSACGGALLPVTAWSIGRTAPASTAHYLPASINAGRRARSAAGLMSPTSPTGHPKRGIYRVFEAVSVVGRGLVSIAEVHAIVARAHLAKSEPEMTSNRFGFSERHSFVKSSSGSTRKAAGHSGGKNALPIPIRFLVALFPMQDLLRCAKHLFIAAIDG